MPLNYIDRPPRIQPTLPIEEISIPAPPDINKRSQTLLQLILPLFMIVGYILVSLFGGGRNILFMIPMGLTVVITTGLSAYMFYKDRQDQKEQLLNYANRLRAMRQEMEAFHHAQRLFYSHTQPDSDTISLISKGHHSTRVGQRLWERRPEDWDFGSLRVGIGDIPSSVIYKLEGSSNTQHPLYNEAKQLEIDSQTVNHAPLVIYLRPYYGEEVIPLLRTIKFSIGLCGEEAYLMDVVRALLMQFTALHSYHDSHIFIIGTPESSFRWHWARLLPHLNSRVDERVGDRMCFEEPLNEQELKNPNDVNRMHPKRFWEAINKELSARQLRLEESEGERADLPFLLVVVDNLPSKSPSSNQYLEDSVSEAAVSKILSMGDRLGVAILFLVQNSTKIPSDCGAIIEITPASNIYHLRYSEVGVNSARLSGAADRKNDVDAEIFAQDLIGKYLRVGYGEGLRSHVPILDLYHAEKVQELPVLDKWNESKQQSTTDWLRASIGERSGGDILELYFQQDHDGVHGMVAGTTGSGKSELLLSLILSLAINHDPSILNFVLVDFKGGSAFTPIQDLPHIVDIVTNLDGRGVNRMFSAIEAELNRRSEILAQYQVKDVVDYRRKGYHKEKPFPHLFIIVDEFAEMMTSENKAYYKERFESITRVGRSIGVNLLLATQRPMGVVTDQMRSNIKLKICLRVETSDDSRELLGQGDAMFLPSGLPGRAYLQIGRDPLNLVQVAWAGEEYRLVKRQTNPDQIIFNPSNTIYHEYIGSEVKTVQDMIVNHIIQLAEAHSTPQHKPWPDPLMDVLSLTSPLSTNNLDLSGGLYQDALDEQTNLDWLVWAWLDVKQLNEKIKTDSHSRWTMIKEHLKNWRDGSSADWMSNPLRVSIGIVDIPSAAKQYLFNVDLSQGHVILFGAGGYGKTTFLKTLIITLAARLSPYEINFYVLDFARGGLSNLNSLPHLEKSIDVTQGARLERLLRVLANTIARREEKIRTYESFFDYNAQNPADIEPAIVVVIDNFAEFKEMYEQHLAQLASIIRSGRSLGVFFVVTADQTSSIQSKIYSSFTQRYTLKLADNDEYGNIVGRIGDMIGDVPGRGATIRMRKPCEMQIAVPTLSNDRDYEKYYQRIAEAMEKSWQKPNRLIRIEPLANHVSLERLLQDDNLSSPFQAIIGIRDIDRQPSYLDIRTNAVILGAPLSGKTTLLQTILASLALSTSPDDIGVVLIDPKRKLFEYASQSYHISHIPHVLMCISEDDELQQFEKYLNVELNEDVQSQIEKYGSEMGLSPLLNLAVNRSRKLLILIDNYDDIGDLKYSKIFDSLAELARRFRDRIYIIIAKTPENLTHERRSLLKYAENSRTYYVLKPLETIQMLSVRIPYSLTGETIPVGRAIAVRSSQANLIQVASVQSNEQTYEHSLDHLVGMIIAKYPRQVGHDWIFKTSIKIYDEIFQAKQSGAVLNQVEFETVRDEVEAEHQRLLDELR